jgi:hypothetical protein
MPVTLIKYRSLAIYQASSITRAIVPVTLCQITDDGDHSSLGDLYSLFVP